MIVLTAREQEILRQVAAGRTNEAIAHQLEISPRTVAKHLEHAYRKLGVANRAAAVFRGYSSTETAIQAAEKSTSRATS